MTTTDAPEVVTARTAGHGRCSWWRRVPARVRRPVVLTIGVALVLTGCVLVVLPGPFTIPPILLGLAVLGSEFAWAHRLRVRIMGRARRAARAAQAARRRHR